MSHILVAPFDEELIRSLPDRTFVVRTSKVTDLPGICRLLGDGRRLHCILLETERQLADLELPENVELFPLALRTAGLGALTKSLPMIRRLKDRPVRVFLPCGEPKSCTEARILASLGVHAGIWPVSGKMDWDSLDDLMHYAAYGRLPHATIEPFEHVLSGWQPEKRFDPLAVIFEDPCVYLQLDEQGRIALNRADLVGGRFIGAAPDFEKALAHPDYVERSWPYGESFLHFDDCSCCAGWKACVGRFQAEVAPEHRCRRFFVNLMDAAEMQRQQRLQRDARRPLWKADGSHA